MFLFLPMRSSAVYALFSSKIKFIPKLSVRTSIQPIYTATDFDGVPSAPRFERNQRRSFDIYDIKSVHGLLMSYIANKPDKGFDNRPIASASVPSDFRRNRRDFYRLGVYALDCSYLNRSLFAKNGLAAYYRDALNMLRNDPDVDVREMCNVYYHIAKLGPMLTDGEFLKLITLKSLLEFPMLALSKDESLSLYIFEILIHALHIILGQASSHQRLAASDQLSLLHARLLKSCDAILRREASSKSKPYRCLPMLHRLFCKLKAPVPDDLRARLIDFALQTFDEITRLGSPREQFFALLNFYHLVPVLGIGGQTRLIGSTARLTDDTSASGPFWIDKWLSRYVYLSTRCVTDINTSSAAFSLGFVDLCAQFDRAPFFLEHKAVWMELTRQNVRFLNVEESKSLWRFIERIADSSLKDRGVKETFLEEMRQCLNINRQASNSVPIL